MKALKTSSSDLLHSIPPTLWLVFVWCALWQNFSLPFLAFGLVLAVGIVWIFRLPTLYLSNRFNPWYAIKFLALFIWNIAVASVHVMWLAFTFTPPLRNSVVAVQLRTRSDLLLTAVSHTMSLIPGSVVVEVDRSLSVLYFHVLDSSTEEEIQDFIRTVGDFESLIIKAVGSKEEHEALLADEKLDKEAAA